MSLNVENSIRFNHMLAELETLADMLNNNLGDESAIVSYEEGSNEDTTALLFLDLISM